MATRIRMSGPCGAFSRVETPNLPNAIARFARCEGGCRAAHTMPDPERTSQFRQQNRALKTGSKFR